MSAWMCPAPLLQLRWGLRHFSAAACVAWFLASAGCGYIGGVQPPLANIPTEPTGLAVLQRGATLYANFKIPELTTEQMPIRGDLELDLRAGIPPNPWNVAQWTESARKIAPSATSKGIATYQFPAREWIGKEVTVAARVIAANGKPSVWSNVVTIPVAPPLPAPSDLNAEATAKGVRLTWRTTSPPPPAGAHFRILRRSEDSPDFAEIGTSTASEFLDASAEFDKPYTYLVQAFEDIGDHREAQSDLSPPRSITPKDVFAPAAPAHLSATPSASTIELSWDANMEPDLSGYRIYRSVNGGAFEKIAEVTDIPAYSDRGVQTGRAYRYAVTAFDKSGNESQRSNVVEAAIP